MLRLLCGFAVVTLAVFSGEPAWAATVGQGFDGATLQAWWVLPFACMLLSIALIPMALPGLWQNHYGKISLFWALAFLVPFAALYGFEMAYVELMHTMVLEYIPFLFLLFALFTISGGIRLTGRLAATPLTNVGVLALGTVCASLMGTTGASMLFIRPLLRANEHRKFKTHTIIFFIFLVSNIGGALTPLGDPPLFLGFLHGVDFTWTTTHIYKETLFVSLTLLLVYFLLETRQYGKETEEIRNPKPTHGERYGIEGGSNFLLLIAVVGAVLLSGLWQPETSFAFGPVHVELQDIVRDVLLLSIAGVSMLVTSHETRELNHFEWDPIIEVAKIFFGIFVSMIPAIAILKAGSAGALHGIIALVSHNGIPQNHMYFWLSGILSSFLDNAPTYLVFFNTAGGDANQLMTSAPLTLAAISCGSVFMGANSYIGNAPNFMVRSIAESQGVKMPSFIGYLAWSCCILIPVFLVTTFLFFL